MNLSEDFDIDNSPQNQIYRYIEERFSPEKQIELRLALDLCQVYDHAPVWQQLCDVLNDFNSEDNDVTQQSFLGCLDDNLIKIFQAHQLDLTPETDLHVKTQCLGALYRIQHTDNPEPYLRILETDLEDEEKLARILSEFSEITIEDYLTMFEYVPKGMLLALEVHLTHLEKRFVEHDLQETIPSHLLSNLHDVFTVIGQNNFAYQIIVAGMPIALPYENYLPYLENAYVADKDEDTARNVLGILSIARDTYTDPIKFFHECGESLIPSLEKRVKIETLLGKFITDIQQLQKARYDALGSPTVQRT